MVCKVLEALSQELINIVTLNSDLHFNQLILSQDKSINRNLKAHQKYLNHLIKNLKIVSK